jgi:CheY-like chemotaxis protein
VSDPTPAGPSVLVVDDEAGILDSLRILLKNEGFTPHVALGGRQGLEQIEALSPDVVLSDIRMPGRVGDRQGGHRPLHSRPLGARRRLVPVDQLRRVARIAARE